MNSQNAAAERTLFAHATTRAMRGGIYSLHFCVVVLCFWGRVRSCIQADDTHKKNVRTAQCSCATPSERKHNANIHTHWLSQPQSTLHERRIVPVTSNVKLRAKMGKTLRYACACTHFMRVPFNALDGSPVINL